MATSPNNGPGVDSHHWWYNLHSGRRIKHDSPLVSRVPRSSARDENKNVVKVLPKSVTRFVHKPMPESCECGVSFGCCNVGQLEELFRPFLNFLCQKFLYELFKAKAGIKLGRPPDVILTPVSLNTFLASNRHCSFATGHVLQSLAC